MKKRLVIVFCILALLLFIYCIVPGFMKCGTVYVKDFAISNEKKEITINIGNASSIGYIRKAAVHQQKGGKLYIDFYGTFGGFNSHIGAKNQFTLPLENDITIIAVYRNTNAYEEILYKNSEGDWQRR